MGKKSSKAPDTRGAAEVEGKYSREVARDTTYADRPDQYNPFGSVQWETQQVIDPATGEPVTKWVQSQRMSEDAMNIYAPMYDSINARGQMSNLMNERIWDEMGVAPNWDQFGNAMGLEYDPTDLRTMAENAAYNKAASRLDQRFGGEQDALEIKLANQGLAPGDQAYDAAMENFRMGANDAYDQAMWSAVGEGRAESGQLFDQQVRDAEFSNALRSSNIDEYLGKRGFSLGEASKLDPSAQLGEFASVFAGGGGA